MAPKKVTVAALYVLPDGPYSKLPRIDLWDKTRDARKYRGPYPVIAHPPCERWGRYWGGGPSAQVKKKLGDDEGCFEAALKAVREFGGVIEHPEASYAFKKFKLPIPAGHGGWSPSDSFGGRSCCVAQGNYGHPARKMTGLYSVSFVFPELTWGPTKPKIRMDLGFHSVEERRKYIRSGVVGRLSKRQRLLTPVPFRDLLVKLASFA